MWIFLQAVLSFDIDEYEYWHFAFLFAYIVIMFVWLAYICIKYAFWAYSYALWISAGLFLVAWLYNICTDWSIISVQSLIEIVWLTCLILVICRYDWMLHGDDMNGLIVNITRII